MATPNWQAGQAGILGTASAVAASAQVDQLLGTHNILTLHQGVQILAPSQYTYGSSGTPYKVPLGSLDFDQPFVMSGSSVGRIQLPILPVGNGADLLVSLCSDSSGSPGTMITQTRIPASWITQLSPVMGVATGMPASPIIEYTGSPVAAAQFSLLEIGNFQEISYPVPAVTGISAASSSAFYNPFIVQIGGVNGGAALDSVFTYNYGTTGALGKAVPQPNFPANNDGSSATIIAVDAVSGGPVAVNTGGSTTFAGATIANVYTSNLDASAGSLSAWSAQTALPYAVQNHTMAASGGYVYVIGGRLNASTGYTNVTYGQVQNGQITAWTATTPLPAARALAFAAVSNGYLFVAGGQDAGITTKYTTAWYAAINANGSLGPWLTAPSLPNPDINLNDNPFSNSYGLICGGATYISCLPVTAAGPGFGWTQSVDFSGNYPGFSDNGGGLVSSGSQYNGQQWTYDTYLMGYLSVPLPASGLTNGATYHILMQQAGGTLNDYLVLPLSHGVGVSGQSSPRATYTWTTWPNDGTHIVGSALAVFDQTAGGPPLHTWEDGGARVSTLIYASTPDQRLLGLAEATQFAYASNANQGFESGIAPWTVTNGTAAQSTTEVFEGSYSAQITTNASINRVFFYSEMMPCLPGQTVTAACQAWFTSAIPTGSGNGVSIFIDWYTAAGGALSTSGAVTSASASTWTQFTETAVAPATAYQWQMHVFGQVASGTFPVFYVDNAYGYVTTGGPQVSSVVQVEYPGVWPTGHWPPQGLVELA